jgi:hypothetical protein
MVGGSRSKGFGTELVQISLEEKNIVVVDLQNHNWTRGLWRMSTSQEMAEFVLLWGLLEHVQLCDEPDQITWKWNAKGVYTTKSAYAIQFQGSYCTFNAKGIWKAWAEGKHCFFTWLLVQKKLLTADRLLARNWPCNPTCPLCDQELESAEHLTLQCVFAREVWALVSAWSQGVVQVRDMNISIEDGWNNALQGRT